MLSSKEVQLLEELVKAVERIWPRLDALEKKINRLDNRTTGLIRIGGN